MVENRRFFPQSTGCENQSYNMFRGFVPGNSVGEGMVLSLLLFSSFSLIPKTTAAWYSQTPCPGCIILNKGWKGDILAIFSPGILRGLLKKKWSPQILHVYLYTVPNLLVPHPSNTAALNIQSLFTDLERQKNTVVLRTASSFLPVQIIRIVLHPKGNGSINTVVYTLLDTVLYIISFKKH